MVADPSIAVEVGKIVGVAVPIRLVFTRKSGITNASTAVQLLCDKVKPGEWWVLDHAALYNNSGEQVTSTWMILKDGVTILVAADDTVANGAAVGTNILPMLRQEEQFGVQVTGSAAKGTIWLFVEAHAIPSPD